MGARVQVRVRGGRKAEAGGAPRTRGRRSGRSRRRSQARVGRSGARWSRESGPELYAGFFWLEKRCVVQTCRQPREEHISKKEQGKFKQEKREGASEDSPPRT